MIFSMNGLHLLIAKSFIPSTATAGSYTIIFTTTELAADLATVTRKVYAHLYDSVAWRDTIEYQVTAIDEDRLPDPVG